MKRLFFSILGLLAACAVGSGLMPVALAQQNLAPVQYPFSLTAAGQRLPTITFNGPITSCAIVIYNSGGGFTLVPQVSSDALNNPTPTWVTDTNLNSGSISATGSFVGNVSTLGLTAFGGVLSALTSGTITGVVSCSGSLGYGPFVTPAPGSSGYVALRSTPAPSQTGNAGVTGQFSAATYIGGITNGVGLAIGPGSIALVGGGTGYAVGDTITTTCASCAITTNPVLAVNAVSGGVITSAMVINPGVLAGAPSAGVTLTQSSTTGTGSGASFTGTIGLIASNLSFAGLGTGGTATNGSTFLGAEQPCSTMAGSENTFIGDRAGGNFCVNVTANTAVGHNACGTGAATNSTPSPAPVGNFNTCLGDDAGRNISGSTLNNNTLIGQSAGRVVANCCNTVLGASAGNTLSNGTNNTIIGYQVGSTTIAAANRDILIGINNKCDVPVSTSKDTISICGVNGPVITVPNASASPGAALPTIQLLGQAEAISSPAVSPTPGVLAPFYTHAGLTATLTEHCVNDTATAAGASTSVTFTGAAIMAANNYFLSVWGDTTKAVAVITAQSTTGFTFTSVNTDIYDYLACGP